MHELVVLTRSHWAPDTKWRIGCILNLALSWQSYLVFG